MAATSGERLKGIKIAVANPTDVARTGSNVIVPISELKKIAPDLMPGCLIVTATNGSTVQEDAAALEATETKSNRFTTWISSPSRTI